MNIMSNKSNDYEKFRNYFYYTLAFKRDSRSGELINKFKSELFSAPRKALLAGTIDKLEGTENCHVRVYTYQGILWDTTNLNDWLDNQIYHRYSIKNYTSTIKIP